MDDVFYGEIGREDFLASVNPETCCKVKKNLDMLDGVLREDGLVLLTKTNEAVVRGRRRFCIGEEIYCLADSKNVNISYFAREWDNYIGSDEANVGALIGAEGLVHIPTSPAHVLREGILSSGKFSVQLGEESLSRGYSEGGKYSTYKTREINLPIEISYKGEDIDRFLKMVHWESGVSLDDRFFDKVLKSFRRYEKNREPIISLQRVKV